MVDLALNSSLVVLAIALVLAFLRLVRGPTHPDRVVALDLIATAAVSVAAVYAIAYDAAYLLDFAVVMAIIAWVGTVAFARILERREQP